MCILAQTQIWQVGTTKQLMFKNFLYLQSRMFPPEDFYSGWHAMRHCPSWNKKVKQVYLVQALTKIKSIMEAFKLHS